VSEARLAVASTVAILLARPAAWGHTFPPVRTVVVQVERCELAVLVGYRPGSGEATTSILTRVASQPKSQARETLRDVMATSALAPLAIELDGVKLGPKAVRAKIGIEPGGARPMIVLLVTYALPVGRTLAIRSRDPRSMRISWTDRSSGRVPLVEAPAQGHWFGQVASFLLSLDPTSGGSECATPHG
jgi:hypothetical protein